MTRLQTERCMGRPAAISNLLRLATGLCLLLLTNPPGVPGQQMPAETFESPKVTYGLDAHFNSTCVLRGIAFTNRLVAQPSGRVSACAAAAERSGPWRPASAIEEAALSVFRA